MSFRAKFLGAPSSLFAVLLVGVVFLAYLPAFHAGFIWDDDATLTSNALIKAPDGLARLWFSTEPADYWPVSYSSLWLEWRLWGLHAAGYHAVNVALHAAECLLLWAVLRRLSVPGAGFAALLFAVHPLNVESVAWIAQRKNLLAMLFFLLSVYSFLNGDLVSIPSQTHKKGRFFPDKWTALSLFFFIAALLSKGSVAPLPLVLTGILLWRRKLTSSDWMGLVPFFLAASAFTLVDIWFQSHGLAEPVRSAGFAERMAAAAAALLFYLGKALIPVHLSLVYPQWHVHPGDLRWWMPFAAVVALTALLWRIRPLKPALFGWGYFCVMLLPALGLTDVAFMQYSLVADHYEHLAIIGIVALAGSLWARHPSLIVGAALVVVLGSGTFLQCQIYRDKENLYQSILKEDPKSWLAYNNLGIERDLAGRTEEARELYERALKLNPNFAGAHYDLGRIWAREGHYPEAAAQFQAAFTLKPHFAPAAVNWGSALLQEGDVEGAVHRYEAALQLEPGNPECHDYLGIAFARLGNTRQALSQFEEAVRLRPSFLEAHKNLSDTLKALGRDQEAEAEERIAEKLRSIEMSPK